MVAMDAESMPRGFGIARIQESGTASHELIYEHVYAPRPVRYYSEIPCVVVGNSATMRPAVRNGKVDFHFFGNRVPVSADHARCWMGHLLLAEVQKGTLAHAEFIVQSREELRSLGHRSVNARHHVPQPSWLWDVWPTNAAAVGMKNGRMDGPGVEVLMRMSPDNGISLELFCKEEGPLAEVRRVLKQYCDDDADQVVWQPIPDPPSMVSKVVDRQCSPDTQWKRSLGLAVPESAEAVLKRSLKDWDQAEAVLVQAISRAQAKSNSASSRELLQYCGEVGLSIETANSVRLRLRPEWTESVTAVLQALLQRCIDEEANLVEALEMTKSICSIGIRAPDNLESAERAEAARTARAGMTASIASDPPDA